MRDFGKVSPTFWTGETGRKLREYGAETQLVALYLITCPSANMIGLYYLPLPVLCHELGMSNQGACKALARVSEGGFAHYDTPSEAIFVPEMAKWQIGETLFPKDNRHKGVIREWNAWRKCRFYMEFYARYKDCYNLPEPSPLEAPWKPLLSQEQEQEQEQEQKQNGKPASPGCACGFDAFWEAYPRKVGKQEAKKAFDKAVKQLSQDILRGEGFVPSEFLASKAAEFSDTPKGQAGQYCPHPSTWLNAGRYDDDPEEWQTGEQAEAPPDPNERRLSDYRMPNDPRR